MNNKPTIKLIKKSGDNPASPETPAEPAASPTTLSATVRSWIHQLRDKPLAEALPAFDHLFKRALSDPPAPADPVPVGQTANGRKA